MKRIGIAIDKWKLKIFKKVLNEGGYKFEQNPGLTKNMLILSVEVEDNEVNKIADIVAVANNRVAKSKSKRWN